jgi:predicted nucleic acid-binding Zn ribbon protein
MNKFKNRYRDFSTRSSQATPLKEALNDMFQKYRLSNKFNEMKLIGSWESIMGKPIASRTSKIYIKDKTLFVKLSSAPLKNELLISKNKILELLEKEGAKGVIEDIRFL